MKIEFAPPALDVAKTREALAEASPTVVVTPGMCTSDGKSGYVLNVSIDMIVLSGVRLVFGREWKDVIVSTGGSFYIFVVIAHETTDKDAHAFGDFEISMDSTEFSAVYTEAGLKKGEVFKLTVNSADVTSQVSSQDANLLRANRVGRSMGQFAATKDKFNNVDAPVVLPPKEGAPN